MEKFRLLCRSLLFAVLLPAFPFFSLCRAAEGTPALIVRESGASLYSQQESESDKIATLQKGETLLPLGGGRRTTDMVHGQDSAWLDWLGTRRRCNRRRSIKRSLQRTSQRSTWSARTITGQTLEGSWTVEPTSSADKASGTWTLGEGLDKTILRGSWSAQKFSTGWSGTWRATVEGQKREFTGSWTADFPQARETSIGELFSTVARDAIRGIWSADNDSGSWSLRAAK